MMLDADVQTGIVVDRNGAVQGLLTIDAVADKMREGEHSAEFDQVPPPDPEIGEPDAAGLAAAVPGAVEAEA
jgi:CBS domain containing-hemolysin-like protein